MRTIIFLSLFISAVSCMQDHEYKKIDDSTSSAEYIKKAFEDEDLSKFPQVVSTEMQFPYEDRFSVEREMTEKYDLFSVSRERIGNKGWEAKNWRKEDAKVMAFLEKKRGDKMYAYVRQLCALKMLSNTGLLKDDSKQALPVIAKYLDVLAEERNGSPAHYYFALQRLKGYWAKDKLRSVAEFGIVGGRKSIQSYENAVVLVEKEMKVNNDNKLMLDIVGGYKEVNVLYQKYMDRLANL